MKNIKNNKTILAVIPAVVVLTAGVAFFALVQAILTNNVRKQLNVFRSLKQPISPV